MTQTRTPTPPPKGGNTALARREVADADSLVRFAGIDEETMKVLMATIGKGASVAEIKVHLMQCQRLGLTPVGGHAHFVPRWVWNPDTRQTEKVWATQVGIDGYRSLAEDTGKYDGPAGEPRYQYLDADGKIEFFQVGVDDDGQPVYDKWTEDVYIGRTPYAAKVGVWRKGRPEPVWATAYYDQYVQTNKEKKPNAIWAARPHPQLAKCAEALALRQAFPRKLGGTHTVEEMGQAGNGYDSEVIDVTPESTNAPFVAPLTAEQEAELRSLNASLPDGKKLSQPGATRIREEAQAKGQSGYDAMKAELERRLKEAGVNRDSGEKAKAETEPEPAAEAQPQEEPPVGGEAESGKGLPGIE